MLTLGNHDHATVIGRQKGERILISLFFISLILTAVVCQRPPGEAFPLAQQIDAQVGSHSIQPLAQALPIAQLLPVHTRPQEALLRRLVRIFLLPSQTIQNTLNSPSYPLST